ncbi:hypothetical protein L1987_53870 [Smallanthus sonchifolius]|uniref:Uncharacterized protein n=1 Tax=Smallanthus sonchifolius TaxID=185202 RepID=A0ACB9EX42_9ASTR|nr:hypothetical protein L1987_53870 [Smallanthus sonchifolius]
MDSSRGWNPFKHPILPPVVASQVCTTNKSASTIPTVSSASTGGLGLPVSSSGSNSSSVQSSPVNPMVWADVVKGLHTGLKSGLKPVDNTSIPTESDVSTLPESEGVSSVVGIASLELPDSQPEVFTGMTSAQVGEHAADVTDACSRNPTGLPDVGPKFSAGLDSDGPVITDTHVPGLATGVGLMMIVAVGLASSSFGPGNACSSGPPVGPLLSEISGPTAFNTGPGLSSSGLQSDQTNSGPVHSESGVGVAYDNLGHANFGPVEASGLGNSGTSSGFPDGPASSPSRLVFGPKSGMHPVSDGLVDTKQNVATHFSTRSLQFGSMSPTKVHDDLMFACDKNVRRLLCPRGLVWWLLNPPPPRDDDGFMPVQSKKWRVKKPNTGGPNGMSSEAVDPVSVGPISVGPKDVGLVDVPHVVGPLPMPKGNMRDKGKIPVSNQFDSLGGPVLDDFDDFFDGVTGLWESERQTAHYYIEYGFKPPDFVFEKWSPKLKVYYSQLTKVDSTDPGGPSKVIEEDELIGESDEEPPDGLLLG